MSIHPCSEVSVARPPPPSADNLPTLRNFLAVDACDGGIRGGTIADVDRIIASAPYTISDADVVSPSSGGLMPYGDVLAAWKVSAPDP